MESQPATMASEARAISNPHLSLPEEIVVWEILVRLPPKSLLRCRAVCRDWHRATCSHEFLPDHHGRQPCLHLLYNWEGDPSHLDIIPFDHRAGVTVSAVAQLNDHLFNLKASCDGLLIISDSNGQYSICNAVTREYAPLPQLNGFTVLGMYPHSLTDEYRLLLRNIRSETDDQDGSYIFTLGSGKPPRHIGCPVLWGRILDPCVLFHGNLYWYAGHMVLVFDTTSEPFRHMRSPVHGGCGMLFEMDGMLACASFKDLCTIIDISAYEHDVWAFKCRFELPVEEIRLQFPKFESYHWDIVVTSLDNDVLVLLRFGEWLLQIDVNGKFVASFHRKRFGITRLRLKQTLVPHTFLPTLEGYVVNDSPFI